jgi:dynamin-binding protein
MRQLSGATPESRPAQKLHAIINVPTPHTSPPLRSSRPRRSIDQARSVSPDANRASWDGQEKVVSHRRNASFSNGRTDGTSARDDNHEGQSNTSNQAIPASYLLQLPTTTYQRPDRGLKINVEDLSNATSDDPPSTATTQFEEDQSPSIEMPGTFPQGDSPESKPRIAKAQQDEGLEVPPSQPNGVLGQLSNRSRTVLSQIMEMRRNRDTAPFPLDPSPTAARSSLATQTDAGTIQIMLDGPTAQQQSQRFDKGFSQYDSGVGKDASSDLLPAQYTDSNTPESPWTPSRSEGDAASQMMTDNDYSAISRILDQYHQSGVVSPAMVHEFQQYILDVDPDLLGTDEAEKQSVAKTALEDIIRDHTQRLQESPNHRQVPDNDWQASEPRFSVSNQDQDDGSVFESSVASATDSDSAAPSQSDNVATSGYQESSDAIAPSPPPKDNYSSDRGDQSYASLGPNAAQDPSTDPSMDRPTLPHTPVTGGSIGFSPNGSLFGEVSGQKQAQIDKIDDSVENHVNGIIPIVTLPASPEHEEDTTPTAVEPSGHETYDTSYSTPASSMRDAPSISDSQQVPSSKTSLMDSTASEQTLTATNSSPAPDPEQKRLNRRYQVLKELLDTEASYIQDMKVVEDIYKETSEHCIAVSADDRRVLFGNSKEIIKFSESFLSALKKAAAAVYVLPRNNKWRDGRGASFETSNSVNGPDEPSAPISEFNDADKDSKTYIGQIFNEHMLEMEELYSTYLRNHDFANQRLKRLQEVPRVKLWLTECHSYAGDITSAWDLDSLLVKPVQRILKYPLLLKALIETTSDAHPDFPALEKALKNMTNASVRINEAKKRAEVLEAMMSNNKRKDFDISKLLGRRTDKLRQQVGLSDAVDDTEYRKLAQKFETRYVHLQIVMRDFGVYKDETEKFMIRVENLMSVVEENIAVGRTETPELESKWRKLVVTFREMQTYAWRDHVGHFDSTHHVSLLIYS